MYFLDEMVSIGLSEQGTATINQKFGCNTYNGTDQGKECTRGKSAVQDTYTWNSNMSVRLRHFVSTQLQPFSSLLYLN
jgi:hypothetical protein